MESLKISLSKFTKKIIRKSINKRKSGMNIV